MDIPENERTYIYKHLGHSENINKNIYQSPLGIKEITVVGRKLQEIDDSLITNEEGFCSCENDDLDYIVEKKKERAYSRWTKNENLIIKDYFKEYLQGKATKKLPSRKEILEFKEKHPEIEKEWFVIRNKMMNECNKNKLIS